MMRKFEASSFANVVFAIALFWQLGCVVGSDDKSDDAIKSGFFDQAPLGSFIGNITAVEFAEAQAGFSAVEELEDGVGPVFNERACGNCHTEGAVGGAGLQIERRFGRFVDGKFDPISDKGGTLRQLFAAGSFSSAAGKSCDIQVESEPEEATVHNVGRLTTPLFGLGLVDAMPDSFFDFLAQTQPESVRGIVNRVSIVLPNLDDPTQTIGGTRVGRFGWKAGVSTLSEFAADAYVNEMGITTQHCVAGQSIESFATESAPNGVPVIAGCDDLAPAAPEGVVAGVDEFVGTCDDGRNELQSDVELFRKFMTHLAPPPREVATFDTRFEILKGQVAFMQAQCQGCHTNMPFTTPIDPTNGVPGSFTFFPYSDFLVHDMGSLGDQIGNAGDSEEVTRRMRTAPLWGLRYRTNLLHDGRAQDIDGAVQAHDGQGAASRDAYNQLSDQDRSALATFIKSL
jgi:CxxC motif-containing protein (DUF1111 family)